MKTVRFARVVDVAGEPQVHTRWTQSGLDAELKRALAGHRVMTVQHVRGKTDVGTVGLAAEPASDDEHLIFPKSLRRFAGARIVGVKFDLVAHPKLASPGDQSWVASTPRLHRKAKPRAPQAANEMSQPLSAPPPDKVSNHDKPIAVAESTLVKAVRAALRDLKRGKTVAAYQRLERALPSSD